MRRLPLLLALVAGVALWAAPSEAQVADFFKRYVIDSAAPGQGNNPLPNGYEMCPPNTNGCSHESQAHHHIAGGGAGAYDTDILDVHNCSFITVCLKTADDDGTTAALYVESVLDNVGTANTRILADFDGDGVINAVDEVPLDGDDGTDSDQDGTALQLSCLYDISGHNKVRLSIQNDGGAGDESYAEVSCR